VLFLVDVAHGSFGEVSGRDVALTFAHDGHVRWSRHDGPLLIEYVLISWNSRFYFIEIFKKLSYIVQICR
jgi:hypothetical protein